jgi:hypothetical protein
MCVCLVEYFSLARGTIQNWHEFFFYSEIMFLIILRKNIYLRLDKTANLF